MRDFFRPEVLQSLKQKIIDYSPALLFFYLMVMHLAGDSGYIVGRFNSLGIRVDEILSWSEFLSKRAIFLALHVSAMASIVGLAFSKSRIVAVIALLILLVGNIFDLTYFYTVGRYATISDIKVLIDAIGHANQAAAEYLPALKKSILVNTAMFFPVGAALFFYKKRSQQSGVFAIGCLVFLAAMYSVLAYKKGEKGLVGFPSSYSSLFSSVLVSAVNQDARDTGKLHLESVELFKEYKKIVVVMDESILGSEFKVKFKKNTINTIVYPGITYSGANVSAASNYFFRKAVLVGDEIVQIASLFELAHEKSYYTVYIDNQGVLKDHGAKNYMDKAELSFVDSVISNVDIASYDRDGTALQQILSLLNTPRKTFIYINKFGAHVPYNKTIPPRLCKESRMEDYQTSVQVNSIAFLDRLASNMKSDTIVFYTSDHGQNFGKGPAMGNTGDDAAESEWDVPFALATGDANFIEQLKSSEVFERKFITHFEIAELVRNVLGYQMKGKRSIFEIQSTRKDEQSYCGHYGPPFNVLSNSAHNSRTCKVIDVH